MSATLIPPFFYLLELLGPLFGLLYPYLLTQGSAVLNFTLSLMYELVTLESGRKVNQGVFFPKYFTLRASRIVVTIRCKG